MDKIQLYLLIILNYVTLYKSKFAKLCFKEFRFFMMNLFQRANTLDHCIRQNVFSTWINMTCHLDVDQLNSLVKETQFVFVLVD